MVPVDRLFAGFLIGGLGFALLMVLTAGAAGRVRLPRARLKLPRVRLPRNRGPRMRLPRVRVARMRTPRVRAGRVPQRAPGATAGAPRPETTFIPPGTLPILLGLASTLFGATGLLLHARLGFSPGLSLALSPPIAVATTGLLALGLWEYFTLGAGESEVHGDPLVGKLGHVSVPIPADGVGAVALVTGGRRVTMPAVGQPGAPLERGAGILVVDVVGHKVVVEEFDSPVVSDVTAYS